MAVGIRKWCLSASVLAGYYHSMAIGLHGQLYVWGCNNMGQLGTGTKQPELQPVQLRFQTHTPMVDVSAGAMHCMAIAR